MTKYTDEQLFERWKRLADDDTRDPWDRDHVFGLFQNFRPDGVGVKECLEGVVGGDEILPRLMQIYTATKSSGERSDNCFDAYFVVRKPEPIVLTKIVSLLRAHLRSINEVALEARQKGIAVASAGSLLNFLPANPRVEFAAKDFSQIGENDPESDINNLFTEWHSELTPVESQASLLREAFYSIACNSLIAYHVTWPLYRHSTTIPEPFAPYFELWKHGVDFRIKRDKIRIRAPSYAGMGL